MYSVWFMFLPLLTKISHGGQKRSIHSIIRLYAPCCQFFTKDRKLINKKSPPLTQKYGTATDEKSLCTPLYLSIYLLQSYYHSYDISTVYLTIATIFIFISSYFNIKVLCLFSLQNLKRFTFCVKSSDSIFFLLGLSTTVN